MSFHNQAFWMGKSPGCLNDDDVTNDNSSGFESKRTHQWFMDGSEVDLYPNKKQAVEAPNNLLSGMLNSNASSWGNSSGFHSLNGHFTEQFFAPDATTMNLEDANTPSVSIDNNLSVESKDNMDPFGSKPSFGLSISTALEDPRLVFNYDGFRKVKVNQVKESENLMSVASNNPYDSGVSDTVSNPCLYNNVDTNIAYNKEVANLITMDGAYGRKDNSFLPMSQSYNKGNDSLSMHPTFNDICNRISSMDQGFNEVDSNVISIAQAYNKVPDNCVLTNHLYNEVDNGTIPVHHTYHKEGNDVPFASHSYNKGESTIISFGGCDDDDTTPSDLFISNYELLMCQALSNKSEAVNEKELLTSSSNLLPITAQTSATETENVTKTKEEIKVSKKATSNNFPSNVRSLLATGMLDGLSVKYKAWSREELRGIIKGAGYLCSCHSCNFSKVINAYEFERHAGCKTKHPNNHIYFDNGKTIYGVVQELRSTPQSMLFEVIQTITGSPIDQKSFCIWKESFLAAAGKSSAYVENKK